MNWRDYIPPGFAPEDGIVLLAALAAGAAALAVYQTLLVRDHAGARIRALAERRTALRNARLDSASPRRSRIDHAGFMRTVVQRLNLLRSSDAQKATDRLAEAGLRGNQVLVGYMFARLALPFAFGAAALLFVQWLQLAPVPPGLRLPLVLTVTLLGALAPSLWLRNRVTKRQQAVRKGLPDGLDLLVICAEAGLSLDAALGRVGREMLRSCPELGEELGLAAVELGFLPERRQALDNLAKRVALPSIRALVNTLQQTEKYGTPLAQSLRVLSAEFRNERMMRAEEKAARLPAVMTVPMIIFILPALFVVLIGPAALRTIDMMRGLH
jgi:tight adherence protein C